MVSLVEMRNKPQNNFPKYIFWHHTGGTDADPMADTSHHTFETIQSWHINGRGWDNIGYHGVAEKGGRWTEGRPETHHAAAAHGYNNNAVHYVMAGNFDATDPTEEQVALVVQKTREAMERWGIPVENVLPHRSVANKSCYGRRLSDDWVQKLVTDSKLIPVEPTCAEKLETYRQVINKLVAMILAK